MQGKIKKTIPTYESQQFGGKVVIGPDGKHRKIALNASHLYQHFLDHTCKLGDEVTLNITNKRPKRSLAQNNYLHLYLSLISLSSGHTLEELKIWVKGAFLSKGIREVFGHKVRVVRSTANLNTLEFIELLEKIEEATGIPLPETAPFLLPLSQAEYDKLRGRQLSIYASLVIKKGLKIELSTL